MTKSKFLKAVKQTEKTMTKKKFSAKQLAAQKKFAKIMKSGGFKKKKKKSKSIKNPSKKKQQVVRPSKTKRSRGGSVSDINKSLLLGDISRLKTSRKNKLKIISSISKRLKI